MNRKTTRIVVTLLLGLLGVAVGALGAACDGTE
jgi:hypothetical protein